MPSILRFAVAASCAVLAACGGGGDAEPAERPTTAALSVYLMVGQSTLHGADATFTEDFVRDMAEADLQTDADRSTLFTIGSPSITTSWGDIRGHNGTRLSEPMFNGKSVKVIGPEVGFAREFGGNIAIIKFANNYQVLEAGRSAWVKPGSRWTQWQAFVDERLATIGRPYKVAGLVWFQGIDDAVLQRTQDEFTTDLTQVVADVHAKFGAMPVVVVRDVMTPYVSAPLMQQIRAGQEAVGSLPGNAWINTDDLPVANVHHLTAEGQIEAGRRLARAIHAAR